MRVSDLDSKLAFKKCLLVWKFSCGAGVQDPAMAAAVAQATTVAQVQSVAWELPCALVTA